MNILTGNLKATSGEIRYNGEEILKLYGTWEGLSAQLEEARG